MLNIKNFAILGLIGVVAYIVMNPGFLNPGTTGVSLGYVLSNGETVNVQPGQTYTIFRDPQTFGLYADSSMRVTVDSVFAKLSVNAESGDESTALVSWTGIGSSGTAAPVYNNSSATVNTNEYTTIETSLISLGDEGINEALITNNYTDITFRYDVTATAGSQSDSTATTGTIRVYVGDDGSFSLFASVDGGTLSLMG